MNITGKRIAILVDNYFEQAELEEPLNALRESGADVDIISTDQIALKGMNHTKIGDSFEADMLINQANIDDYDGLVIPGGAINSDKLRVNQQAQEWAAEFMAGTKPIAVICHGPWLLISADLVDGRRLTSYHTIRDDVVNAGGEWIDLPVVIDSNLITSRQPDDLPYFNDTLITILSRNMPSSDVSEDDKEEDDDDENVVSGGSVRGYNHTKPRRSM